MSARKLLNDILSKYGLKEVDLETKLSKFMKEYQWRGRTHYKQRADGFITILCNSDSPPDEIVTTDVTKIDCAKCLWFLVGESGLDSQIPLH